MDRVIQQKVIFHRAKAQQLEREWHNRKTAGERRIQKMEEELKLELDRLQNQINQHLEKAHGLSDD